MKKKETIDSSVSIPLFDDEETVPVANGKKKPETKKKPNKTTDGDLHESNKHTVPDTGSSVAGSWHSAKKKVEEVEKGHGISDINGGDKHDGRILGTPKTKTADTKAERGSDTHAEIGKPDDIRGTEHKEHIGGRRKGEPSGRNTEAEGIPSGSEKDKQGSTGRGGGSNPAVKRTKNRYQTTSSIPEPGAVEYGPVPIKGKEFLVRIKVRGEERDVSPWSIKNGIYIPGLDSEFLVHCYRPNHNSK